MKPHMRQIVDFLRDIGAGDIAIANGGKHPRVVFLFEGSLRSVAFSGTPSNQDECARRAIEDIRRALDLIDHEKRVGVRRPRQASRQRLVVVAPPLLMAPPAADWRDSFALHPAAQATIKVRLDGAWWAWWREIRARVDAGFGQKAHYGRLGGGG